MMGVWRPLEDYRAVNVTGTQNVCRAALAEGVSRVVHVSSWTVYGMDLGRPAREDFLLRPFREPYAMTKAEGDVVVQRMIADEHLPAVIIRPGTFFGPGDRLHFGRMADRLRAGKGVIVGRGDNALPFVYVTDVVQGLLLALDCDHAVGQAYNITNDRPLDPAATPRGDSQRSRRQAADRPCAVPCPLRRRRRRRARGLAHQLAAAAHRYPPGRQALRHGQPALDRQGQARTRLHAAAHDPRRRTPGRRVVPGPGPARLVLVGCGRPATRLMNTGAGRPPRVRTWNVWPAALLLFLVGGLLTGCTASVDATVHSFRITDYTRYVDNDQGPGEVFMRYPLGRIGLWSTPEGEIADSVTRGLLLYPTVDQVVDKGTANWRASISASPSETTITYAASVAAKGSAVALTVTPDVSVYRYHFSNATSYEAVDLLMQEVENSNVTWSSSRFAYVDRHTAEVTLSNGGNQRCYFYIKFSSPAASHGTFTSRGATGGGTSITGDGVGGYLAFAPGTPVTVAVALSMTSMSRAQRNFTSQFPTFDFARAVQNLKNAWNAKLGQIDVQSASTLTAKEIYTGLYTLYANIIDVTDNGSGYSAGGTEHETAHHRLLHLVGASGRRLLPVLIRSGPQRLRVLDTARSGRHEGRAEHVSVAVRP